jgi:chemotaxis protein CheD
MKHNKNVVPEIFLHPGEFHLSTSSEVVTTVLGSCVSVIMFDKQRRLSMMSHNLLPSCGESATCKGNCSNVYKYAECSVKQMLNIFDEAKIPYSQIIVKLFGGSELMNSNYSGERMISIGSRNIEAAMKIIEKEGLQVVAQDLGGASSRKVIFFTNTGEVFLSRTNFKPELDL